MDNTKVDDIINYIAQIYDVTPEYLFRSDPECCVFRHCHSKKWFGIIMNISADKVELEEGVQLAYDWFKENVDHARMNGR